MRRVVIVGGGISGLSAAYYLRAAGIPSTIVERESQLGGLMRTEVISDCVVESGPDSFLTAKPWARELIDDLGLGPEVIGSNDHLRATYIWRSGALVRMPEGMKLMVPSALGPLLRTPLLSWSSKVRILTEQLRRPRAFPRDRSVAEFVKDHFGSELLHYIAEPLLAGVYGGDPAQLSAGSLLPQMVEWEARYGSLSRAARSEARENAAPLFSTLREGLGTLIAELARQAAPEIIHGTAEALEKGYRLRVNGDWIEAQHVVLACRPTAIVPDLFPEMPWNSCTVVALAYRRSEIQHPLNGFGFLVPAKERRGLSACTWVGTKFAHRVPQDKVLLRCFTSGPPDDIRAELAEKMGITAEPLFSRVIPWPESMPQYPVGHADRVRIIEEMLRDLPGLHVTGNAYHGVGIPDCIRMAKQVAARIAASAGGV